MPSKNNHSGSHEQSERGSGERVVSDFKKLVGDTEEFLASSAGVVTQYASDTAHDARDRLKKSLDTAKRTLAETKELVVERTKDAAKATDTYVRENPWKAVGIAAGAAWLMGIFMRRRRK